MTCQVFPPIVISKPPKYIFYSKSALHDGLQLQRLGKRQEKHYTAVTFNYYTRTNPNNPPAEISSPQDKTREIFTSPSEQTIQSSCQHACQQPPRQRFCKLKPGHMKPLPDQSAGKTRKMNQNIEYKNLVVRNTDVVLGRGSWYHPPPSPPLFIVCSTIRIDSASTYVNLYANAKLGQTNDDSAGQLVGCSKSNLCTQTMNYTIPQTKGTFNSADISIHICVHGGVSVADS